MTASVIAAGIGGGRLRRPLSRLTHEADGDGNRRLPSALRKGVTARPASVRHIIGRNEHRNADPYPLSDFRARRSIYLTSAARADRPGSSDGRRLEQPPRRGLIVSIK